MAERKAGIKFEIGGSTQSLTKALKESKDEVKLLASETKKLQSEFKFEPNLDKVNDMLTTNRKSAAELTSQIAMLEEGLKRIERTGSAGNTSDIKNMTKDLNNAKAALNEVNFEAAKLEKLKLSDFGKELELTKDKAGLLRDRLDFKFDKNTVAEFQKAAQEQIDKTSEKLVQLRKIMADLERENPGAAQTREFKELENQVIALENELQQAARSIKEVDKIRLDEINEQFRRIGDNITGLGMKILPLSAAISGGIGVGVKAAMDYESAFARVRKVIDGTTEDYARLSDMIKNLSEEIPVAATELAALAETGGRLGIAQEGIEGFVRTMANVGATTNLAGQEGASMLATFANITQMPIDKYENLGSAVLKLDTAAAASAKQTMEMSVRLAGAGKQAGMTEAEILGLSSGLASLGINAQAGGSAFSKIISEMQVAVETGSDRVRDFADVAGMSAQEFARAFRDDATGALLAFVNGLANASDEGSSAIVMLEQMEISQQQLRDSLLRSAGAGDMLTEMIETSREAWEKNTDLVDKAAEIYGTTASKLEVMRNQLVNIGAEFGEMLLPVLQNGIEVFGGLLQKFSSLDDESKKNILTWGLFVAALAPALMLTGNLTKSISDMVVQIGVLAAAKKAKAAASTQATAAQIGLNTAMAANPIGLVITAVGALVAVLGAGMLAGALTSAADRVEELNKKLEDNKQSYENATEAIKNNANAQEAELNKVERLIPIYDELNNKVDKTAEEKERLKRIVDEINRILPNAIEKINEETGAYETQISTLKELIRVKRQALEQEARRDNALEARKSQIAAEDYRADLRKEIISDVAEFNKKYGGGWNDSRSHAENLAGSKNKAYAEFGKELLGKLDLLDETNADIARYGDIIRKWEDSFDDPDSTSNNPTSNSTVCEKCGKNPCECVPIIPGETDAERRERELAEREEHNRRLADINNRRVKNEIDAAQAAKAIWDEKQRYYADNATALLNAESDYLSTMERLNEQERKAAESAARAASSGSSRSSSSGSSSASTSSSSTRESSSPTSPKSSSTTQSAREEREKTPEELYREEKNRQDLVYNALLEGEQNLEQHLENRIALRDKYLTENTDEWLKATAEINKLTLDIEKQAQVARDKADAEKLKSQKDNYDNAMQQLRDNLEDEQITLEEYYEGLKQLREDNAEYLSLADNDRVARGLNQEIRRTEINLEKAKNAELKKAYDDDLQSLNDRLEDGIISQQQYYAELKELAVTHAKYLDHVDNSRIARAHSKNTDKALLDAQKEQFEELKALYDEGLLDFDEFISRMEEMAADFGENNKALQAQIYAEIKAATDKQYADELAELQKHLDEKLLSFSEFIESWRELNEKYYEIDSENFRRNEQNIKNAREQKYREEKEYKDWLRSMNIISDEQYFADMHALAVEHLEAESKLWRDAMLAQHNFRRSEAEKERKARETELRDQLKLLENNLKAEERAITEQKRALEQLHREETRAKQEAIRAAYDERIKAIDKELDAEKFARNIKIAGINEEIKARRELREDENHEDKIARAQKALEAAQAEALFARDDFTRENLEQEVIRRGQELDKLIQERDDTIFYRNKDAEKSALQEQIKGLDAAAKAAKEAAKIHMEASLQAAASTDTLNAALQELDARLEQVRAAYERETAAVQNSIETLNAGLDVTAQVISSYENLNGATHEAAEKHGELTDKVEELKAQLPDFVAEQAALNDTYRAQRDYLREIIAAMQEQAQLAAAQAQSAVQSSLGTATGGHPLALNGGRFDSGSADSRGGSGDVAGGGDAKDAKADVSIKIEHAMTPEKMESTLMNILKRPAGSNWVTDTVKRVLGK